MVRGPGLCGEGGRVNGAGGGGEGGGCQGEWLWWRVVGLIALLNGGRGYENCGRC